MIVKTPMMIPKSVNRLLNLLAHRELIDIAKDSPKFIFAIVDPISSLEVSLYRIRMQLEKVSEAGRFLTIGEGGKTMLGDDEGSHSR